MLDNADFIICIRPSMINYLEKLNEISSFENGILFYSMWKGYQEREDMKYFLDYMESRGVFIVKYKCRKLQTKNVGRCNCIL